MPGKNKKQKNNCVGFYGYFPTNSFFVPTVQKTLPVCCYTHWVFTLSVGQVHVSDKNSDVYSR